MKRFVLYCAATMMFLTIYACDKAGQKRTQPVFSANPTKLADFQTGYEMGETMFSPDGRHVAMTGIKDGKVFLFLNSKMSGPFEGVRDLVFAGDSKDFAFIARKGGRESVVVNGVEGSLEESIRNLFFTPERRIIYTVRRNDKWLIVSGKQESNPFDSPNPLPIVSTDGKRLAYTEQHRETKKSNLRVCAIDLKDCVKGKDYDSISMLKTDTSGAQLAYIAGKEGKKAIVTMDFRQPGLIEKEGPWHDDVTIFSISDKGGHLAYLANSGEKALLNIDGLETPIDRYDTVFEMAVSATGRTLYSAIVNGTVRAFIDGKQAGKEYSGVYSPGFSRDGSNYLFTADKDDKSVLVVNGQETATFDKVVTPKFSPDGSKLVYRARQNGERFVVVSDLQGRAMREHHHYEAVWDVIFSPDGRYVGYGVKQGQEFWWKVEKL